MTEEYIDEHYVYDRKNYDAIHLRVPKGVRGEIRAFAKKQGKTTNAWVNGLIRAAMGLRSEDMGWKRAGH